MQLQSKYKQSHLQKNSTEKSEQQNSLSPKKQSKQELSLIGR